MGARRMSVALIRSLTSLHHLQLNSFAFFLFNAYGHLPIASVSMTLGSFGAQLPVRFFEFLVASRWRMLVFRNFLETSSQRLLFLPHIFLIDPRALSLI